MPSRSTRSEGTGSSLHQAWVNDTVTESLTIGM